MEDERINPKVKKIIIIVGIFITLIILVLLINKILDSTNRETYEKYLIKNGYEKLEDKSFYKEISTDNLEIIYRVPAKETILTKEVNKIENEQTISMNFTYNNDNTITTTYNLTGINKDGNYANTVQTAIYNSKNKKFSCEYVIDGSFGSKCNEIKKETLSFNEEVQKIIKESKINPKHIK